MRFAPSGHAPPWPYSASKVLREPMRPLTFNEVIQRLQLFNRDGLLLIGTQILWYAWEHPKVLKAHARGSEGNNITRNNAERLITLACVFASSQNLPMPQEVDFRLLCWELHMCPDGPIVGPEAIQQVSACLEQLPKGSPLRKLDAAHTRSLLVEAFKVRIVAAQFEGRTWDRASLIRPLLIARELAALARKAAGDGYDRAERHFFLTTLEGFFRASWALYGKADEGVRVEIPGPRGPIVVHERGRFLARDWQPDAEAQQYVGLTDDDMRAVTSRLSKPLSEYPDLRSEISQTDPVLGKYSRHTDFLATRPLIDLELEGRGEHLLLPSPWRFVSSLGAFVLHEFVAFLQAHRDTALNGRDAYSLRGDAFGNYLRNVLRDRPGVYDLDVIDGLEGPRPDFLWVGQEYGVLVEAKVFLRPNDDRLLAEIPAAVETWKRAAETITQASGLLRKNRPILERRMRVPEKWVLVVVSNEEHIEDSTGFKSVARLGNLLNGTGLDALVLLDASEFENWIFLGNPDDLARRAMQIWSEFNPGDLQYERRVMRPANQRSADLPHIAEGWRSLLPGFETILTS